MTKSRPRRTLAAGALLLAVLALLPYLIPIDSVRLQVEKAAAEAIGSDVSIASLRISWVPLGVVAHDTHVGGETLVMEQIVIPLELTALLKGSVSIPRLSIEGVTLRREALALFQIPEQPSGEEGPISIRTVALQDVTLLDGERRFGPYRADIRLDDSGSLAGLEAARHDESLRLTAKPDGEGLRLAASARQWQLPVGLALEFQTLEVSGRLENSKLYIEKAAAEAYQGAVEADAIISWESAWKVNGRFESRMLDLEPLLAALGKERTIAGRLNARGQFDLLAPTPLQLGQAPVVEAEFKIRDGIIYKADLEKAAREMAAKAQTGGQTPFESLEGKLRLADNQLRIAPFAIRSRALEATGALKLGELKQLEGRIDVGLKNASTVAGIPLQVRGTTEEPKIRLTDSALAGAAAGTGLLGPGVGTAVGLKAGQFFDKLKGVFGGGDDE